MPDAGGHLAGMGRAEWLAAVVREANVLHRELGAGADAVELETAASRRAAEIITVAPEPMDFIRHSGLAEPDAELWQGSRSWADAVVAVACACLEHDIVEHVRMIASGRMPETDPERLAVP